MGSSKERAKAAKKLAKAQAKLEKKRGKALTEAPSASAQPATTVDGSPSPAERSAAAAERQVRLQRLRVWIALVGALVAAGTFLATVKPWRSAAPEPPVKKEPATLRSDDK